METSPQASRDGLPTKKSVLTGMHDGPELLSHPQHAVPTCPHPRGQLSPPESEQSDREPEMEADGHGADMCPGNPQTPGW